MDITDTRATHDRVQTRTVRLLFGTQILGGVGVAIGIAVGALLLEDLTGTTALAGLGQSSAVVGGALLAIPIIAVTTRYGRRGGLALAYGCGVAGAVAIVTALWLRNPPLAFAGMFLLGGGTAANLQARYAAADLARPERRGRQLAIVVWATTIGAVAGPSLAPFADTLAGNLFDTPRYAGPFIASAIGFAAAAVILWVFLRPDPLLLARGPVVEEQAPVKPGIRAGLAVARANPDARTGITAVALGHLVMVAVMAMTPIHIKHGTPDPDTVTTIVGVILSLHIAGMYALSPVAGYATDRFGPRPVIFTGVALLLAACATAGTSGSNHTQLAAGLLLLGLGWSCTMVAGSAMLTNATTPADRPAVQGLSDLTMGLAGAAAGAASGFIIDIADYPTLTVIAAVAIIPATVQLLRHRSAPKEAT